MSRILFTTCTVDTLFSNGNGWLVRWFVHLVNSMPFNALLILILIAGCQPTLWTTKTPILFSFARRNAFALTVHAVHWILSNITYITDWMRSSLRIGSWVSFIILTFCVYLLFFVVILESWHCYLRTHSHTLGQENGQNKCTLTLTQPANPLMYTNFVFDCIRNIKSDDDKNST